MTSSIKDLLFSLHGVPTEDYLEITDGWHTSAFYLTSDKVEINGTHTHGNLLILDSSAFYEYLLLRNKLTKQEIIDYFIEREGHNAH